MSPAKKQTNELSSPKGELEPRRSDRLIEKSYETVKTDTGRIFSMESVVSSAVSCVSLCRTEGEIAVIFKIDPRIVYIYDNVTDHEFSAFEGAPSKGRAVIAIKMTHSVRKEVICSS